jgi:hypothetical protein
MRVEADYAHYRLHLHRARRVRRVRRVHRAHRAVEQVQHRLADFVLARMYSRSPVEVARAASI